MTDLVQIEPAGDTGPVPPMIKAENVHKSFGHLEVLKGIDVEVHRREVCVVVGPSGSGKSTLLRCVNHLEKINAGRIWVDGDLIGYRERGGKLHELKEKEVAAQRRSIGMVFQRFNLFPHMTAIENVMEAPLRVRREPKAEVRERATALLERVGLADKVDAYPNRLSGGQQQRVAIVRALAMEPDLILLDEITSALDPALTAEVLNLLRDLARSGMTMVLATHEMAFARDVSNRVCFLDAGRILEEGPPAQIFGAPREERTRQFLQRIIEAGRL